MSTIDSILESVKKVLGLHADNTDFDVDVTMHINSIFSILAQLGIGPETGFAIEDDSAEWSDFLEDELLLNNVKTYVYLRVRMLFDPPTNSFTIDAMNRQIDELTVRINMHREYVLSTAVTP